MPGATKDALLLPSSAGQERELHKRLVDQGNDHLHTSYSMRNGSQTFFSLLYLFSELQKNEMLSFSFSDLGLDIVFPAFKAPE